MNFVTKVFILLSILTALIFLLVAGSLVAKQEAYKQRLALEKVELEKAKLYQEALADRLAALQEEKRRRLRIEREKLLVAKAETARAQRNATSLAELNTNVDSQINRFEDVTREFDDITNAYKAMIEDLIARASTLAQRKNNMMEKKSQLWQNVAEVSANVGKRREDINVLDYQLYHLNEVNQQKRELLAIYRDILGPAQVDTWGPQGPRAKIIQIDEKSLGGIVIIDAGASVGVREHQTFAVVRGDQYCGRIEIIEVWEDRAAGRILQDTVTRAFKVGDDVRPPAVFAGR